MIKTFVDKIPQNSKIAIFGAGFCGRGLKKYIAENRKDINVVFYVDSFQTGQLDGLDIINFVDIAQYKSEFDLLIYATTKAFYDNEIIFDCLNIKCLAVTVEIEQYFRTKRYVEKQKLAVDVFKYDEDKKLYNLIWDARVWRNFSELKKYVREKHNIDEVVRKFNYNKHYFEYINTDVIEYVIDGGIHNGITLLAFNNNLPKLKKIYGFEPMYDKFKVPFYDSFIKENKIFEIIPLGLWDCEAELSFKENLNNTAGSRITTKDEINSSNIIINKIQTTSVDVYTNKNDIKKVDFIKLDVEGAEINVINGAIKTIEQNRPQMAISIYHSNDDFVEIPTLLNEKLDNYTLRLGHYSSCSFETVLYAIPNELIK